MSPFQENRMNFAGPLLQLLPRQIAAYTRFLDLLHTEQTALAQTDPALLENCTAERARLTSLLEAQDLEMRTLFNHAQITFSPQAAAQLFSTLAEPQRTQLLGLWQQVLALAAECKKHNDINRKIVDTRSQQTGRLLRILMGQTTFTGTTYAADGRVQPGSASATLATV